MADETETPFGAMDDLPRAAEHHEREEVAEDDHRHEQQHRSDRAAEADQPGDHEPV